MNKLKTDITEFTHIFHVADIHIRLTKRHDEYREVLNRLYAEIDNTPTTTLVCILGDVIHSKTDLTPECVQLIKDFFYNVAQRRTTILVAGNHDTNLANKNRLDSLTPVVEALNHSNLHYLKKSGLYGIGNVCLNNYSILEKPDTYINGKDIPAIYRNQYQHFVVLFHGPVDNALTDIGFRIVNKAVPVSMFDYHDIALLGDIHMPQDLQRYDYDNDTPAVHYCGSLIQQNHGEALVGHGYSLWDLKTKTYTHYEVPNDFGFFTVVLDNGKIISSLDNIPKKSRIQFQVFETVATEVKAATSQLRLLSDVLETSFNKIENTSQTKISTADGNVILGNITDRDYQVKLITEFLKNRLNITDVDFVAKVIKINDDTNSAIKKDDFARNIRWLPVKFEWENMFSYGEGNTIDFSKLSNVVGLFAPNTSGKSSVFSSLTFCIFDKCEREYKAVNILNTQKTWFRCKFEFEIDKKHYFIERNGKADRKGNVKVDVRFWTVENGKDVDLHGDDRKDTNSIIRDYLGTYEDFILTAMSIQGGKNNGSVIDMGNTERKDLLAQFMGLSAFDRLHTEANEKLKELNTLLKNFRNDDFTKQLQTYQDAQSQSQSLYNVETENLANLSKQKDVLMQKINEVNQTLIKVDAELPSLEELTQKKEGGLNNIEKQKSTLNQSQAKLTEISTELEPINTRIDELEKKDVVNAYTNYQSALTRKNDFLSKIDKKKLEISHKIEKVNREKNHKYDPKCECCMIHSKDIVEAATTAKSALEMDKVTVAELLKEYEAVTSSLELYKNSESEYVGYNALLAARSKLQKNEVNYTNQISQIKNLIEMLETANKRVDEQIELYNKNKDAILANELTNGKIKELKLQLNNILVSIIAKNKIILDANGKIASYKTQIDVINDKISTTKNTEEKYKLYEAYVQAVNRDGIPFDVISVTVPEVEREVNSILSQIASFTAKFETDGKNIVPYIVYDDKKWLMSLTSGFEKFALSLAIRVALINISNLPRPNFLILDEGMGVCDAENLSSMQLLFTHLKHHFDFLIVISHLEAARDMVDSQIEITKTDGFSHVNHI